MASVLTLDRAAHRATATADAAEWREVVATVHRQMRSLVGPTRDLEDLTQVALEQVARTFDRFEGRARFSTFTYRVCANVALNHWRSWRRWLARFEGWGERQSDDPSLLDSRASAQEQLVLAERRRRVHAALEKLSPKMRLTLTLVNLEELSVAEAAQILECGEPTVRSRLAVARRELYERLRHDALFREERAR